MRASDVGPSHGLTPLKAAVKGTLVGKMLLAAYRQRRAPAQVTRAMRAAPVSYTHLTLPTTPYV